MLPPFQVGFTLCLSAFHLPCHLQSRDRCVTSQVIVPHALLTTTVAFLLYLFILSTACLITSHIQSPRGCVSSRVATVVRRTTVEYIAYLSSPHVCFCTRISRRTVVVNISLDPRIILLVYNSSEKAFGHAHTVRYI